MTISQDAGPQPQSGSVVQPLAVALVGSALIGAGLGALVVPAAGTPLSDADRDAAVSLVRYVADPFSRFILCAGIAAGLYAALQLWGVRIDKAGAGRVAQWATGRDGIQLFNEIGRILQADRAAHVADVWEAERARRALPLSYAIWLLPLLGFIGTVIGISGAIGQLGQVFADANREAALAEVLSALRFAFDTTFVGLALVIPSMAFSVVLRARSDAFRQALVLRQMIGRD
jgi:hypothetical protein